MYKELSATEEAVGKTVRSITSSMLSDQMIVAFTDETFITFGIEREYESCDDSVYRQSLRLEDFGRDAVVGSGIITQEEYAQRMEEWAEVIRRDREDAERRRYEELKAKFE